jgi:hypothetical protein
MQVNTASSASKIAQQAALAAKNAHNAQLGAYEKNTKAFGPVAATVIGLASSAAQASSSLGSVVDSVEQGLQEVAGDTLALASTGIQELKSAYNTVAKGVDTATSAVASYAATGVSAAAQVLNALV